MRPSLKWPVILGLITGLPGLSLAQGSGGPQAAAFLSPIQGGMRFDDNVYRSPEGSGRLADTVFSLEGGGQGRLQAGRIQAMASYDLTGDLYSHYSGLDNVVNDLGLQLSGLWDPFELDYKTDTFIRSSAYYEFAYLDETNDLEALWRAGDGTSVALDYRFLSRGYFNDVDYVVSRNFFDNGFGLSLKKRWSDRLDMKLEADYNDRQFNRYAVGRSGAVFVDLPDLQQDRTWSADLGLELYLAGILQDIHLKAGRTDSNSYGFSNTSESLSWAGILAPARDLYLQLFFRIYGKDYDVDPLEVPDLQLGFTDDDGQDLLSLKGSWEWGDGWTASLGLSRARNESTQPGQYYIKNVVSAQIKRGF